MYILYEKNERFSLSALAIISRLLYNSYIYFVRYPKKQIQKRRTFL